MSDVIVMTFHALWDFIKKPTELGKDNTSLQIKIGTCLALFLIQIPPLLVLMSLIGGLEQLGLWEEDMHSLQKIFQEMEPVLIFLFAVIVAPLFDPNTSPFGADVSHRWIGTIRSMGRGYA